MHIKLRHSFVVVALLVGAWCSGCGGMFASKPVATPADFERLGTRHYPDRSHEEVSAAVVTALRLLGYDVVTTDPRIRTAPKNVAVTANGTYTETSGTTQSFTEAVAWDI